MTCTEPAEAQNSRELASAFPSPKITKQAESTLNFIARTRRVCSLGGVVHVEVDAPRLLRVMPGIRTFVCMSEGLLGEGDTACSGNSFSLENRVAAVQA